METVIRLKTSDFNMAFLNAIKWLFKGKEEIEVQISSPTGLGVLMKETQAECNARIEKSFDNMKKRRNEVRFTGEEFKALPQKIIRE